MVRRISVVISLLLTAFALHSRVTEDPFEVILNAASPMSQRPIEGRIFGYPHAPLAGALVAASKISLLEVSASVLERTKNARTSKALRARGVGFLLRSQPQEAVETLTLAAEAAPNDPRPWNDLAAAYLARGERDGNAKDFADALVAADRAIRIDPQSSSLTAFNRGLALERLHLDATPAFALVACGERSGWQREAQDRMRQIRREPRREAWTRARQITIAAAQKGDFAAVRQTINHFRQEARTWGEVQLMNDWAGAVLKDDRVAAASTLDTASAVARALAAINGECLLLDSVEHALRLEPSASPALAHAYRNYYEARVAYSKRNVESSLPLFLSARDGFASVGSPMAAVASYYLACARFDGNDVLSAEAELRRVERGRNSRYRALHGQVAWQFGTMSGNQGALYTALQWYEDALRTFELLDEFDNAAAMRNSVASTLGLLGREADAWRLRIRAFGDASKSGDPARLQFALSVAAHDALNAGQWELARSILTVAIESNNENPRLRFDSFLSRAMATVKSGDSPAPDLSRAEASLRAIADPMLRDAASADLALVRARIIRDHAPVQAIELVNRNISFVTQHDKGIELPAALLERARAYRTLQRTDRALDDLRHAIGLLERRRSGIGDDWSRDAFFNTHHDAFEELIDLLDKAGAHKESMEVAERARISLISERFATKGTAAPITVADIAHRLPRGVLVLHYTSLPDRLLVFAISSTGFRSHAVTVTRAALRAERRALVEAILREDPSARAIGAKLERILLDPCAEEIASASLLVIVADDTVISVPFPALYDERHSQYLIERLPIVFAPSASSLTRLSTRGSAPRACVVGNPTTEAAGGITLPPLPEAAAEAAAVAHLYHTSALTGSEPTPDRLMADLPRYDIVHIAAHALACQYNAALSSIALAPGNNGSSRLSVRQIARLSLPRRPLIVLAGCRTATPSDDGGTVQSIATAFLLAGGSNVVGTLWDVDDELTRQVSLRFHEEVIRGIQPAVALKNAQMSVLHSGSPHASRTWSAFRLTGTTL